MLSAPPRNSVPRRKLCLHCDKPAGVGLASGRRGNGDALLRISVWPALGWRLAIRGAGGEGGHQSGGGGPRGALGAPRAIIGEGGTAEQPGPVRTVRQGRYSSFHAAIFPSFDLCPSIHDSGWQRQRPSQPARSASAANHSIFIGVVSFGRNGPPSAGCLKPGKDKKQKERRIWKKNKKMAACIAIRVSSRSCVNSRGRAAARRRLISTSAPISAADKLAAAAVLAEITSHDDPNDRKTRSEVLKRGVG